MVANAPQLHGCVWHEDTLPITTPVPGTGGGGRRLGECLKAEPPNTEGSEAAPAYVHPGLFPLSLWERGGVREVLCDRFLTRLLCMHEPRGASK